MVIAGAVTFGTTYVLTVLNGAFVGGFLEGAEPMFVPIVGPFIAVGTFESSPEMDAVLVISGLAQAGGVAMFITGFAAPRPILRRDEVALTGIRLEPWVGPGGAGLSVVGPM